MCFHNRLPIRLYAFEGLRVGDRVAEDYRRWAEEGVILGRGGVGEEEAVVAIVDADVKGEGLVEVAQVPELG